MDGIIYERLETGWQCTQDRWPVGVKEASLQYANQPPFGKMDKETAVQLVIKTITEGTPHYDRYAVLPLSSNREPRKRDKEIQMQDRLATDGEDISFEDAVSTQTESASGIENAEINLPERETAVLKTRKPRTKVDLEKVKALFAEGKSVAEIASETGVSYMGIRLALINAGLLHPKTRARNVPEQSN
jgi:hypothetical protein